MNFGSLQSRSGLPRTSYSLKAQTDSISTPEEQCSRLDELYFESAEIERERWDIFAEQYTKGSSDYP